MTACRDATVTSKGQVTIPVEMRRALGIAKGGPVRFILENGVITVQSARKLTLADLLAGFDPVKHRSAPEDRVWDDSPVGRENL